MPRGHPLSIYARFLGKKSTSLYILGKKAIIITSKKGITIFFFPLQSFSRKTSTKIGLKRERKYGASITDRAQAPWGPWAFYNTP